MNANRERVELAVFSIAYLVFTGWAYFLVQMIRPMAPEVATIPAMIIGGALIAAISMATSTRSAGGPAAARTFFTRSVNRNSRAVVVITSELDLREIMIRLKAAGLQPMVATV